MGVDRTEITAMEHRLLTHLADGLYMKQAGAECGMSHYMVVYWVQKSKDFYQAATLAQLIHRWTKDIHKDTFRV